MKANKVVIYGHKLHTHTHSYIHLGFKKAFEYLGYDVIWIDNNDDISNIDFSNCIFLTEHQVDSKIPIRDDCKYILHNCFVEPLKLYLNNRNTWAHQKYSSLINRGNIINIQVYKKDFCKNKKKMDDYIYYDTNIQTLYFPWATDILPHEINIISKNLPTIMKKKKKRINFIGTIDKHWKIFRNECVKNGFSFIHYGGYSRRNVSMNKHIQLIQESYFSPTIQSDLQVNDGYIPCRIFKNISYGKMGYTNSKEVYNLFNNKIIYDSNIKKLFHKAIEYEQNVSEVQNLMNFVKEKHTYISRINCIFKLFDILDNKN